MGNTMKCDEQNSSERSLDEPRRKGLPNWNLDTKSTQVNHNINVIRKRLAWTDFVTLPQLNGTTTETGLLAYHL